MPRTSISYLLLDESFIILEMSPEIETLFPALPAPGTNAEEFLRSMLGDDFDSIIRTTRERGAFCRTLTVSGSEYSLGMSPLAGKGREIVLSLADLEKLKEGALGSLKSGEAADLFVRAAQPLVLVSPDGFVRALNPAAAHALFLNHESALNQPLSSLIASADRKEALDLDAETQTLDLAVRVKGRRSFSVQTEKLSSGLSLMTFTDQTLLIGEQKQRGELQDKLEYFESNLKRLTSLAAHDMKEPLVIASIYSELLLEKNRDKLDKESESYIAAIMDMVKRMVVLIDNLVALVRMDTSRPLVAVDANAALEDALKKLKTTIDKAGAVIEKDDLPQVMAGKTVLSMVFLQLLSNALKFSPAAPAIRITCEGRDGFVTIGVHDNGVGFDASRKEAIFELFERLHDKETYPGFGTGLSIARKGVRYFGGKIWAETEEGKGSTFYFTVQRAG